MAVKRREVVRYFEESGFYLLREGKKHSIYTNKVKTIPIKRHRTIDNITTVAPSGEIAGNVRMPGDPIVPVTFPDLSNHLSCTFRQEPLEL